MKKIIFVIGVISLLIFTGACATTKYQCPDGSKVASLEQCKSKTPIDKTKSTSLVKTEAISVVKTEAEVPEETRSIMRERQWEPTGNNDASKKKKSKTTNKEIKSDGNKNSTQISWEKFAVACAKQVTSNNGTETIKGIDQCLLQYVVKYEEVMYCNRINDAATKEVCYQKLKDKAVLYENETRENNGTEKKLVDNLACAELGCPDGTWYTGSKNSDIYHECHCGFAKRISAENRVCFNAIPPERRPSARC